MANIPNGSAPLSIDDILAEATPTERSRRICIRGDLRARFDELEERLEAADGDSDGDRALSQTPASLALAEQLEQVRAEMERHTVQFRFRGIGPAWTRLVQKHMDEQGNLPPAFFPEAVAACAVSPKMTTEQAQALFDKLSQGAIDALYRTVRDANIGAVEVPKSLRSSQILAQHRPESS